MLLKEKTKEARRVLNNKYFKFDKEDNVIDFDKRKFLSDQPKSRLTKFVKSMALNIIVVSLFGVLSVVS